MNGKYKKHIFICINERNHNSSRGDCAKCGGKEIRMEFVRLINKYGLKGEVRANKSGCLDVCEFGAAIVIYPDNLWYLRVETKDVEEIFEKSILKDDIVERLLPSKQVWDDLKNIRRKNI